MSRDNNYFPPTGDEDDYFPTCPGDVDEGELEPRPDTGEPNGWGTFVTILVCTAIAGGVLVAVMGAIQ